MQIRMAHPIELPAEQFFERIYFNEDFNSLLYGQLGFADRLVLEQVDLGDTVLRRVRQVPLRDIPGPFKKILGGASLAFEEVTRFHKARQRADIQVITSFKPDKIMVVGTCWIEPDGPDRCQRLLEVDAKVSIFGIGSLAEKMILANISDDHRKAADITNRYIREHLQEMRD